MSSRYKINLTKNNILNPYLLYLSPDTPKKLTND